MVGLCLRQAGVKPINIQDSSGREVFHPVTPGEAFAPVLDWYLEMTTSYGSVSNLKVFYSVVITFIVQYSFKIN